MRKSRSLVVLAVLLVPIVALASFSWYIVSRPAEVRISVRLPIVDLDGVGAGTELQLDVQNLGQNPVELSFWVMWFAFVRDWEILEGAPVLDPGATQTYRIRVSNIQMAIPDGSRYIVKAFDRISGIYFRSEDLRLELEGSPPLRNSGLWYWSRNTQTGVLHPFAWGLDWAAGADDAVDIGPADASSGARLWLREGGGGTGPTLAVVHQAINASDLLRLRDTPVTLCWTFAIEYRDDPETGYPLTASGVQLFRGGKLAWFVLSRSTSGIVDLPNHRIFVVRADTDRGGCAPLPLGPMIDFIGGAPSEDSSFALFAVAWPKAPGEYHFAATTFVFG